MEFETSLAKRVARQAAESDGTGLRFRSTGRLAVLRVLVRFCVSMMVLVLVSGVLAPFTTASAALVATVSTDQVSYLPGEQVVITGFGFIPEANILVTVTLPNGQNDFLTANSDRFGAFETTYQVEGLSGDYTVAATDGFSTAITVFADAIQIQYRQCATDVNDNGLVDTPLCDWIADGVRKENAMLAEGNTPPPYPPRIPGHTTYRVLFEGLDAGTYDWTITYNFTKEGKVIWDFLTTAYGVEDSNLCIDLPSGFTVSTCTTLIASGPDAYTFPFDDETVGAALGEGTVADRQQAHDFAFTEYSARTMKLYGADIIGIRNLDRTGPVTGDSSDQVVVTFTKSSPSSKAAMALWGAHLGMGAAPPVGYAPAKGASGDRGETVKMTMEDLARLTDPVQGDLLAGGTVRQGNARIMAGGSVEIQRVNIVVQTVTSGPSLMTGFGVVGSPGIGTFSLGGAIAPTLSSVKSISLSAGLYGISDFATPPGWRFTSLTCSDPDGGTTVSGFTAMIDVDTREEVTCTFTATQLGKIVIVKDAVPDAADAFGFARSWGDDFHLIDDAPDSATNSASFDELPAGTYLVTALTANDGPEWDLAGIVCSDPDGATSTTGPTATIDLDPGETVVCTFTNVHRGSLIVEAQTLPQGATTPIVFSGDVSGEISDDEVLVVSNVIPGTYTSTQVGPALGFDLTGIECSDGDSVGDVDARTATFHVDPGEIVRCIFYLTQRGMIVTQVRTIPAGAPEPFTFTGDTPGQVSDGGELVVANVRPGVYTTTQASLEGYEITSIVCDDSDSVGDSLTGVATFRVDPGETVTCVFTNSALGALILNKKTVPSGSSETFTFTGDAAGILGDGGTLAIRILRSGVYSTTESLTDGWELTSIECDDADSSGDVALRTATFQVGPGETVACVFTNTALGGIVLVKRTVPSGSLQPFTFTGDAAGTLVDGGQIAIRTVRPGTYMTTESSLEGWDLTSIDCDDGDSSGDVATRTATFNVDPGELVTCVFTSTQRGTIVVAKQTIPAGSAAFSFSGALSGSISDGGQLLAAHVVPGEYTIFEDLAAPEFDLISIACDDANSVGNVALRSALVRLEAGERVTCTFTDRQRGTIVVREATIPSAAVQGFSFSGTATGTLRNGESIIVTYVVPGTYTVTQGDSSPAFDLTTIACDDGNSAGDVPSRTATYRVDPGETVTCGFTNTARGRIVVEKHTIGGDGTFLFAVEGSASASTAIATLGGTGGAVFGPLLPGTYSVTERAMTPLWAARSATCSDGSHPESVGLSPGEVVTCAFTNVRPSLVTAGNRCEFDSAPGIEGQQFRIVLAQDPDGPGYRVQSTKPGKFNLNTVLSGTPGERISFELRIPYPFVTKGRDPVDVYDGFKSKHDCLRGAEEVRGFVATPESIKLSSYGVQEFGEHATIQLRGVVPRTGILFATVELQYGLKKVGGLSRNGGSDITSFTSGAVLIPNRGAHTFETVVGGVAVDSQTLENTNVFKKNPSIGGFAEDSDGSGRENVKVEIRRSDGSLVVAIVTDDDGTFSYAYRHVGKATTFSIRVEASSLQVSVSVRSNEYIWVSLPWT